jgi:hypothetical protein
LTLAATVARILVRVGGLFQIGTGLLFWTGNAMSLVPIHMLSGLIVSLSLVVLGALGAWASVHPGRVVLAVVWALFVPVFGLTQSQLLPGELHWIVQVAHLVVGLAAMAQAEALAERIRRRPSVAVPALGREP